MATTNEDQRPTTKIPTDLVKSMPQGRLVKLISFHRQVEVELEMDGGQGSLLFFCGNGWENGEKNLG